MFLTATTYENVVFLRRCNRIVKFGKVERMAKKSEVTSKPAATAASKVLRDPKSSPAAKTAAASALTQRPNKKK